MRYGRAGRGRGSGRLSCSKSTGADTRIACGRGKRRKGDAAHGGDRASVLANEDGLGRRGGGGEGVLAPLAGP